MAADPLEEEALSLSGLNVLHELACVLDPLLDLPSLLNMVCLNKPLRERYQRYIQEFFLRENLPTRLTRHCVRELSLLKKMDPRPRMYGIRPTYEEGRGFLDFNPVYEVWITVSMRGMIQNPDEQVATNTFQLFISEMADDGEVDDYLHVGLNYYDHLLPRIVRGTLSNFDIPAYDGEGEDPQIRTDWNYKYPAVLTLNDRVWVGQACDLRKSEHCDFRFHDTPNGVAHALILARDVLDSALTLPTV